MDQSDFQEFMSILQTSGENERIEAKKAKNNAGKSILETISAFSNEAGLGGGYLVLGLSQNDGNSSPHYEVTGVADADRVQSELAIHCRQSFSARIRPDLKTQVAPYLPFSIIDLG